MKRRRPEETASHSMRAWLDTRPLALSAVMSWRAETNLEVAHALHRVAWRRLDDRLERYVDADKRLRRAAGQTPPKPPTDGCASVPEALTAQDRVDWDASWFHTRWENGEQEAMEVVV